MNIKILVATMSMEIGGAETHILELCKALQRKGLRVYVASNGGAYEPELAECGIIHHKVPLHNKQPFNIFAAYRTLKRIIVQNDIRLVHAHARIPAFLCGFLQRKLNFRFVTTAHWVFDTKFPYNLISNWGEKTLAVSEDIKEYLTAHYNVPKNDIFATINGIDTEKFSGSTEPAIAVENVEKSRQSRKNCRIMSISRLDKDRSLAAHLLIEIAPVLAKKFSETIIYIVGGGNDFENVRVKAEKANAEIGREVVVMAGPQVAANRWLASCDVFVGASRAA
ncbi:MAG: glycosyltransferase, partial [Turicibacter sp.]|nr:glycosyltransferase [Turicibacter sp.]